MVGCVGEILRFEGDAGAEVVAVAAFADLLAVHALSCIELESRLVGVDLHPDARRGFISLGSQRNRARFRLVERPVVVVAVSECQRFVVGLSDAFPDRMRRAEVERRAFDREDFIPWGSDPRRWA